MVLSSASWRMEAQARCDGLSDNGFHSSLGGAILVDHSFRVALGIGERTQVGLTVLEYPQVQDM